MLPIRGLYEVAIRVKHLPRAEAFYRDMLGLDVGLRDERRHWVFLRAGGPAGMIVLQEDQGEWPTQHFAFTVDEKPATKTRNHEGSQSLFLMILGALDRFSNECHPTVAQTSRLRPGTDETSVPHSNENRYSALVA